MSSNNIKKVYDALKSSGYTDMGSLEEFTVSMSDNNNRKLVYDALGQEGYSNLGDFDAFSNRMIGSVSEPTPDTTEVAEYTNVAKQNIYEPIPVSATDDTTIRGFVPAFEQSADQLGAGVKYAVGEYAEKSSDYENAYNRMGELIDEGVDFSNFDADKQVNEQKKRDYYKQLREWQSEIAKREEERKGMKGMDALKHRWNDPKRPTDPFDRRALATAEKYTQEGIDKELDTKRTYTLIEQALKDANGDVEQAKALLDERRQQQTWGERMQEEAKQTFADARPTEGFGAWLGGLAPQMVGNTLAVAAMTNPYTRWLARPLGMANMAALTASSGGSAAYEARRYGEEKGVDIDDATARRAGLISAGIEYGTEKIPFDRYFDVASAYTKKTLGKALGKDLLSSPRAQGELAKLVERASKELGGTLINGKNIKDWAIDAGLEGMSEFMAEGGGALVPMIYQHEEDYPTLKEILSNGWEGAKAGMFMGAFLGGSSRAVNHYVNRDRRKKAGHVDLAETKDGKIVEVLGFEGDTYSVMLPDGGVEHLKRSKLSDIVSIPFDEFDKEDLSAETVSAYEGGKAAEVNQYYNINVGVEEALAVIEDKYPDMVGVVKGWVDASPSDVQSYLNDLPEDERVAIGTYLAAEMKRRGVIDGVMERTEADVASFSRQLEDKANAEGNVSTATYKEQQVFVKDIQGDNAVIMLDGNPTMVNSKDISNIATQSVNDVVADYSEQVSTKAAQDTDFALNNHPKTRVLAVNDTMNDVDGKTYKVVEVTGVKGARPEQMMYGVVECVYDAKTGAVQPKNGAEVMRITYNDMLAIQNDYYNSLDAKEAQRHGEQPQLDNVSDGTAVNEDSSSEGGTSISHADDAAPAISLQSRDDVALNSNSKGNVGEMQASGQENVGEGGNMDASLNKTALERVPKDEKGNPIYEQADAYTAWDALVEQTEGDVDMAQRVADDMVADKKAALNKLQNGSPKKGATVAEKIANEKAHKAAIAQAEAEVAAWERIAQTEARRREAAMGEADRYAADMEDKTISEGLNALGEPQSLEEYVLMQLAGGGFKLRWSDKGNGTKGFGSHTGLSTDEMKARLSMIDNTNGLAPEEIAHSIVENMDMSFGEVDVMDVTDRVIDAVATHASRRSMFNGLVESRAEMMRQQERSEQEAKDAWYMEQYHATEEELREYKEYLDEAVKEFYGEDVDYERRIAIFAEIQLQEYGNEGADAGLRPSANQGEGLASDREGGSSVGETEQLNQREVLGDSAGVAASEDQGIGSSVSEESDAERIEEVQDERKKRVSEVPGGEGGRDEGEAFQGFNREDSETVRRLINEFVERTGWDKELSERQNDILSDLRKLTDEEIRTSREYAIENGYDEFLQLLDLYGRSGERLYVLSQSGIIPNQPVDLSKVVELFNAYNGDAGLAALLDRVLPVIGKIAPKITFEVIRDADGNVKDGTVGDYWLRGNHIRFNLHSLNSSYQTDQEKASTIVHEMLHAVAQYAVEAKERIDKRGVNSKDAGIAIDVRLLDAAQSLINIYNKVKDNELLQGEYGVVDVHEMISELANPEFRDKLQRIEIGKRSVWQWIKDVFARIIGKFTDIYDATAYGEAVDALDVLLDNFDKNAYEQARGLSGGAKEARVYHGSGAKFDKFDHSFMGTGEGAQVFGWGTYVTEVDGIARSYAITMREKNISEKHRENAIINNLAKELLERHNGNKEEALYYLHGLLNESWSDKKRVKAQIKIIETGKFLPETKQKANIYTVEIPDNNGSNYLEWYEVVPDEVVDDLQSRIEEEFGEDIAFNANLKHGQDGRRLYEKLERALGSDKAASQFLHEMGYVGIKYPAESLRGGRADNASNYVIFDENDLEIVDNVRFRKERALETVSVQNEHLQTVVSSADGAKVLKDLDTAIAEYENDTRTKEKTFLGNLARVLGAKKHGSNSQYAAFEAMNGKVVTIRLSNHNAKTSTFDNHGESEGISIVVTAQDNKGITNDGDAHLVEFYYDAIKLRKADGKPLAEILKSIKQALYSGEYHDTTGLAERQEVNELFRKGEGAISDREVSYENDPIAKWQGKPRYYGKRAAAFAERERARMARAVAEVAEKLSIEVEVVTADNAATVSQRTQRIMKRRPNAKGWYDIETKKVVVVVPNHVSAWDAVQTVLHEGVAHHGLRELFGDGFDTMLDNVYNFVAPELKAKIDEIAEKSGVDTRVATEEYLASLAEETNFEEARNMGWWAKIKNFFVAMFNDLVGDDFYSPSLTDNELRYILWRSYRNLVAPGSYLRSAGYLEDATKQKELKVGEYAESVQGESVAADTRLRYAEWKEKKNNNEGRIDEKEIVSLQSEISNKDDEGEREEMVRLSGENPQIVGTLSSTSDSRAGDSKPASTGRSRWEKESLLRNVVRTSKSNGSWVEDVSEIAGDYIGNGQENEVYLSHDGSSVIKLNNFEFIPENSTDLTEFVNRLLTHNKLFPNDSYTIIGFGENSKGEVSAILSQPYVNISREATDAEIDAALEEAGFTVDMGDIWFDGRYEISDLKPSNVVVDNNGLLRFIDTVPRDTKLDAKTILAQNVSDDLNGSRTEAEIISEVEREAAALGVPVRIARSVDELPDDAATRKHALDGSLKGLYSTKDGGVVVYLPNTENANDAKRTILHEIVGHKGLRQLIGEQQYDSMMVKLMYLLPADVRDAVLRRAERHGWNAAVAMDEYLAEKAEETVTPTWWGRVNSMIRAILRNMGFDVKLTDADVKYLLWRSRKRLEGDTAFDMAVDAVLKQAARRSAVINSDESPSMRYRTKALSGMANAEYEEAVMSTQAKTMLDGIWYAINNAGKGGFKALRNDMAEAYIDGTRAVAEAQKAIEKKRGRKIRGYEDIHSAHNAKSSKDQREIFQLNDKILQPLSRAVANLINNAEKSFDEFSRYLNAKHGIERNVKFAERDAENESEKLRQNAVRSVERIADSRRGRAEVKYNKDVELLAGLRNSGDLSAVEYAEKSRELKEERDNELAKIDTDHKAAIAQAEEDKKVKRAELLKKYRKNDYSGLTEIFTMEDEEKTPELGELERRAQEYVDAFEASCDKSQLDHVWKLIRIATKFSVEKMYNSSLIGKEQRDNMMDSFEYYVPLRGWKNDYTGDVYSYIASGNPEAVQQVIKHAKGRKSEADNILGTIFSMANYAIVLGNKNEVNLRLLNLAYNDPSGLLNVEETWYEETESGELVPLFPDMSDKNLSSKQKMRKIEEYREKLERLRNEGKAKLVRKPFKEGYPLRAKAWQEQQHAVVVKRGGEEYVVWVNGNPKLAQALNGLLDKSQREAEDSMMSNILRWMAATQTSYSPEFWLTNLQRDLITANTGNFIKYGAGYEKEFAKNLANLLPVTSFTGKMDKLSGVGIFKLFYLDNAGKLDMSNPVHKMFKEFADNGGMTGISQITDPLSYEKKMLKEIDKELSGIKSVPAEAVEAIGNGVEFINRGFENATRFATYMTSRQMGKGVTESIRDAKDVSVNFNMKGSGAWGNAFMRKYFIYFNAAIQGLRTVATWHEASKKRFYRVAGSVMAASVALAIINDLSSGGDDDDENAYYGLSEWNRYNFFNLKIGENSFLHWSLPQEYRPIYALGQIGYDLVTGRITNERALMSAVIQLNNLSPFSFVEDSKYTNPDDTFLEAVIKGLVPSQIKPLVDAYISNEDFLGRRVHGQTDWNRDLPEYKRVIDTTPQFLIEGSRILSEISGGRENKRGLLDNKFLTNPSITWYLLKAAGGGTMTFFGKFANMSKWDEEWTEVPILPKFVATSGDDYSKQRVTNDKYWKYRNGYEETHKELTRNKNDEGMSKERRNEIEEDLKKGKKYEYYKVLKKYESKYKTYRKLIEKYEEEGNAEKEQEYRDKLFELKKKIVAEIEVGQAFESLRNHQRKKEDCSSFFLFYKCVSCL